MRIAISATLLALFTTSVISFKAETHLLVARIAYDILQQSHPQALNKANTLLKVYSTAFPDKVPKEGDYPFVECVTLADDIKRTGGGYQSDWHFIDNPYVDDGTDINDYPFVMPEHDIVEAVSNIMDWLRGMNNYKTNYVYNIMMPRFQNKEENAKSYALRFLIHYLGDIHQPLHCSTRVDKNYPLGDKGGNDFALKNHYSVDNLHALWDAVMYEFKDSQKLPYSAADWATLEKNAKTLVANHALPSSDWQNTDYQTWQKQSFALISNKASGDAWSGITENDVVPQAYINKFLPVLEKQIVRGGMRLAYLITQVYGTAAQEVEEQEMIQPESEAFLQ